METEDIKDRHFKVKVIAANGIVAALYAVITIISAPISYNYLQFRTPNGNPRLFTAEMKMSLSC